jgi:IclR family transcriptional regulator, pca regulon regulatory protein
MALLQQEPLITTATSELGRDFVESLAKGLHVLQALGATADGLSLTETSQHTGFSRAATRRLLLTLVELGYVQLHKRSFKPTARVLSLGSAYFRGAPLWDLAHPVMRRLSADLDESCSAAVLDGVDVIYVARIPGRRIMSVSLNIGARLPAFCTSLGRVLLAQQPEDVRETLLSRAHLSPLTPHTVCDRERLALILRETARDGFALVSEELEIGLRSIAVPILDRAGLALAALNVSVQASRTSAETMQSEFLPRMQAASAEITAVSWAG